MRRVAKHHQVGYLIPNERPGCRNCQSFEQGRREGVALTLITICLDHGFEVSPGGICPAFKAFGNWRRQETNEQHEIEHGLGSRPLPAWAQANAWPSLLPQLGEPS